MAEYKLPGVYIKETDMYPTSIAQVATAIPAFIGYTESDGEKENSLHLVPTRISSMVEYEQLFGKADPETALSIHIKDQGTPSETILVQTPGVTSPFMMYYQLELYFANGGGHCYIVSVGTYKRARQQNPVTPVIFEGNSSSEHKGLKNGLDILTTYDEPTLLLFPDAPSLAVDTDFYNLYTAALKQCHSRGDRFTIIDTYADRTYTQGITTIDPILGLRNGIAATTEVLSYGAAYFPYLDTILNRVYDDSTVTVSGLDTGTHPLNTLEKTDPMRHHKIRAAIDSAPLRLPPSGSIAGVYAQVDSYQGVWKAPANVSLTSVVQPSIAISNTEQEALAVDAISGKSVNAIRSFVGKGVLVWGARTLAGNDGEWRYVPVRRFFSVIEESVKKAVIPFAFEPNDATTWSRVTIMIENFLSLQWRQGALYGAKSEQAFFVRLGLGETMTAQDVLDGTMIIEIGMAMVRPAEFIILKINQKMATQ